MRTGARHRAKGYKTFAELKRHTSKEKTMLSRLAKGDHKGAHRALTHGNAAKRLASQKFTFSPSQDEYASSIPDRASIFSPPSSPRGGFVYKTPPPGVTTPVLRRTVTPISPLELPEASVYATSVPKRSGSARKGSDRPTKKARIGSGGNRKGRGRGRGRGAGRGGRGSGRGAGGGRGGGRGGGGPPDDPDSDTTDEKAQDTDTSDSEDAETMRRRVAEKARDHAKAMAIQRKRKKVALKTGIRKLKTVGRRRDRQRDAERRRAHGPRTGRRLHRERQVVLDAMQRRIAAKKTAAAGRKARSRAPKAIGPGSRVITSKLQINEKSPGVFAVRVQGKINDQVKTHIRHLITRLKGHTLLINNRKAKNTFTKLVGIFSQGKSAEVKIVN